MNDPGGTFARWARVARETSPDGLAIWLIGSAFCLIRFLWLDVSPPGFFGDESRAALHTICLAERGTSAWGEPWPLFTGAAGGGLYTPVYLYSGVVWVKVFGYGIQSFRAMAAAYTLLATVGATALAWRLAGRRTAQWTFLAAACSPWAFQFARIAWDPPLAPAFLVWAVFFWFGRERRVELCLSALFFALALYAYPPTRVQAPLVFASLFAWAFLERRLRWVQAVVFGAIAAVVTLPLLLGMLDGSLTERSASEVIFNREFVESNRGHLAPAVFVLQRALDNLHAHFSPRFLFFTGDENLRHSTQHMGVFGLVDDLALVLVVAWLAGRIAALCRGQVAASAALADLSRVRLAVFAFAAYLFGLLGAALCWSDIPHALRSIGSWPFLAVLTGLVLGRASERLGRPARLLALSVALLHGAVFLSSYFFEYPVRAASSFQTEVRDAVLSPQVGGRRTRQLIDWNHDAYRYFMIAFRGASCASSERLLAGWIAKNRRKRK